MLDNYFWSEKPSTKSILMNRVWYEILLNLYNYKILYICKINIIIIKPHKIMLPIEDITVTRKCIHFMFTINTEVQNMYTIEIAYVNENDAKSKTTI